MPRARRRPLRLCSRQSCPIIEPFGISPMNSLWLVVTALAAFAVAYRLMGPFWRRGSQCWMIAVSRPLTGCATTLTTSRRGG